MRKFFYYDSFEDMYTCRFCNCFFYPEEIWEKQNRDAGIWKLSAS